MGHGIAELAAIAGYEVTLRDIEESYVEDGYEQLEWSVEKLADKGQLDDDLDAVLERVRTTTAALILRDMNMPATDWSIKPPVATPLREVEEFGWTRRRVPRQAPRDGRGRAGS